MRDVGREGLCRESIEAVDDRFCGWQFLNKPHLADGGQNRSVGQSIMALIDRKW